MGRSPKRRRVSANHVLVAPRRRFVMRYLAHPWKWSRLIIITVLLVLPGCSGRPGRIRPPDVDADEAAEAAIEQLDKDGDGQLNDAELGEAAGLAAVKDRYDTD